MAYHLFKITLPENICEAYVAPSAIPEIKAVDVYVDEEDAGSQDVDIEITRYAGTGNLTGYSSIICTSATPTGVTLPITLASTGNDDANPTWIWIYPELFPSSVTIQSVKVAYVIDGVVGQYSAVRLTPLE